MSRDFASGVAVGCLATLVGHIALGDTLTIGVIAGVLTLACAVGFVRTLREVPLVSRAVHEDAPDLTGRDGAA